jgi:hypothetical protein
VLAVSGENPVDGRGDECQRRDRDGKQSKWPASGAERRCQKQHR